MQIASTKKFANANELTTYSGPNIVQILGLPNTSTCMVSYNHTS